MQKWDSDLDCDSESEQYQRPDGPPRYTGAPVERWKIDSVQQLIHHAAVGSGGVCLSYSQWIILTLAASGT